jgi:alkanesulfonate monooxygenase SsuD/methylene tetrahydromethanopterin reductase-like flavin-dependent oxidoreductase (luciferase family)
VPNRSNAALLAKQIASVDALSAGRLVLGVGLGGRRDDYAAGGVPTAGRGKWLEAMLDEMKRIRAG